jgi:hypothetical protein
MKLLLRTDGTHIDLGADEVPIAQVQVMLNATALDTVSLRQFVPMHLMLVDDNGHARGLPLNRVATALYLHNCRPGCTHVIVGDVVIIEENEERE